MPVLTLANFVVGSNTVLAIDTTVDASYTFAGFDSTYHLDVSAGALTFTSPDGTVSLPGTVLLRNSTHYYKFTVAGDMWTATKTGTNAAAITVSLLYTFGNLEVTWSVDTDPDANLTGTYRLGFDTTTATDMVVTSSPTTILAANLPASFTDVIVGLYDAKGLLTSGTGSLASSTTTTTTTTTAAPTTTTTTAAPVCFLGDAPVKTPSGYRRMDSLKVGDRVSTPTGTAVIQNIHCQEYTAGLSANPYVIPKGRFGATQELLISPRHKVSVKGRMVEARDLGLQQRDVGPLTYYNLGLKGANMIVAGVTVESLASLTRIIISRAEFNRIVAAQHGGRITPEIAAACRFLQDGTVSVPALR